MSPATRNNAVAAEVRCIEVRMVEDVEELRAELHREALVNLEVLEQREVEPVESRTCDLSSLAAQSACTAIRHAAGRSIRNRSDNSRNHTQLARLAESSGVSNPERSVVSAQRRNLDPKFWTLAGKKNIVAARSRGCAGWAAEVERLPALQGYDPVRGPSAENRIGNTAALVHELLAFAHRQLISAAEVEHVAEVEISQSIVELWARDPAHCRREAPPVLPPFNRSPASDNVFDHV